MSVSKVVTSNSASGLTAAVTTAIGAGFFPVGGIFVNPRAADGKRLCQLCNQVDNGVTNYLAIGGGDAATFGNAVQAALTADAAWIPYGDPIANTDDNHGNLLVIAFQKGFGT